MLRASATRRVMPPDSSEGMSLRAPRRPTACFISTMSRIMSSGNIAVHQREGHVFINAQVGEQGATLEQHAHLFPQPVKVFALEGRHIMAVHGNLPFESGLSWPPIRRKA